MARKKNNNARAQTSADAASATEDLHRSGAGSVSKGSSEGVSRQYTPASERYSFAAQGDAPDETCEGTTVANESANLLDEGQHATLLTAHENSVDGANAASDLSMTSNIGTAVSVQPAPSHGVLQCVEHDHSTLDEGANSVSGLPPASPMADAVQTGCNGATPHNSLARLTVDCDLQLPGMTPSASMQFSEAGSEACRGDCPDEPAASNSEVGVSSQSHANVSPTPTEEPQWLANAELLLLQAEGAEANEAVRAAAMSELTSREEALWLAGFNLTLLSCNSFRVAVASLVSVAAAVQYLGLCKRNRTVPVLLLVPATSWLLRRLTMRISALRTTAGRPAAKPPETHAQPRASAVDGAQTATRAQCRDTAPLSGPNAEDPEGRCAPRCESSDARTRGEMRDSRAAAASASFPPQEGGDGLECGSPASVHAVTDGKTSPDGNEPEWLSEAAARLIK
mmetsp:Transcript_36094/g.75973  ORF Transcript_36094/g.75973 Transcript_36094/m.75973 type:complete len:454 (+) Transcript_36094:172-1533(+)